MSWAYLYAIIGFFYPQSYMIVGQPGQLVYADALYLSITALTSTGFGDVTPLTRPARGVCMIEQIAGALFVAILIARLAGVYRHERVTSTTKRRRPSTTSGPACDTDFGRRRCTSGRHVTTCRC